MIQPWFREAKFGIFVHWGIYAVGGREASWAFYNHGTAKGRAAPDDHVDHATYMTQAEGFTAARYDPRQWARLFKQAGARYAVLTTKHHDGMALWDTAANDLSVVKKTPAGRDLVGPFCEAMRAEGLKVGLYYSHPDWTHPDFASVWYDGNPHEVRDEGARRYTYPVERPGGQDLKAWKRFLAFHRQQVMELCDRYEPDLLWFDGGYERTAEQWKFPELATEIRERLPNVVINNRGGFGDYETPEQAIPLWKPGGPWELCMTSNHQWGYSHDPSRYHPTAHLTRMLAEVAGMGGNLLLNVGPREDGVLPEGSVAWMANFGRWISRVGGSVFGTSAGLPLGYTSGASTLAADKKTVYVFVFDRPWRDVAIKGIINPIKSVTSLGSGRSLDFRVVGGAPWAGQPGILWVDVPESECDELGTVVAISLEEELRVIERT